MLSRRKFLGQISVASAYAWTNNVHGQMPVSLSSVLRSPASPDAQTALWKSYGRIVLQHLQDSTIIQDGFTIGQRMYVDCDFSSSSAERLIAWPR
jgi:hypothetical protein